MTKEYKNLIFTDHALERMRLRKIEKSAIVKTIEKSDSRETEDDGNIVWKRVIRKRDYHVVSEYLKDEKKWLIISAWVRGEDDPKPLWKRLLHTILTIAKRRK